ncbi:MAG: 3-deoxy-manno-octulosonate cytidylyltransferase [Bacteroidota bacterium]
MPKNKYSLGIIPARFGSTRFPGKPLADIYGKPMIQRVYEQALKSDLDEVVVATDDERIFQHILSTKGRVVMTSAFHKTGTDRCAEVAALPEFVEFEMVVNIQGDEPFIQPEQINQVVGVLKENDRFQIATLVKKIKNSEQLFNPNSVKVVFGREGRALYFSRTPIPHLKDVPRGDWLAVRDFYHHVGIYGFQKNTLLELTKLPPSNLEQAESLEQLRWMENGFEIGLQVTDYESFGIDVPEDVQNIPPFLIAK